MDLVEVRLDGIGKGSSANYQGDGVAPGEMTPLDGDGTPLPFGAFAGRAPTLACRFRVRYGRSRYRIPHLVTEHVADGVKAGKARRTAKRAPAKDARRWLHSHAGALARRPLPVTRDTMRRAGCPCPGQPPGPGPRPRDRRPLVVTWATGEREPLTVPEAPA